MSDYYVIPKGNVEKCDKEVLDIIEENNQKDHIVITNKDPHYMRVYKIIKEDEMDKNSREAKEMIERRTYEKNMNMRRRII